MNKETVANQSVTCLLSELKKKTVSDTSLRVLIVEPMSMVLDALSLVLDEYQLQGAKDLETFKRLLSTPFDVILMSEEIEGQDGLSLIREYRKNFPFTKTVLMASKREYQPFQDAVSMGELTAVFLKPFHVESLRQLFQRCHAEVVAELNYSHLLKTAIRVKSSSQERERAEDQVEDTLDEVKEVIVSSSKVSLDRELTTMSEHIQNASVSIPSFRAK